MNYNSQGSKITNEQTLNLIWMGVLQQIACHLKDKYVAYNITTS